MNRLLIVLLFLFVMPVLAQDEELTSIAYGDVIEADGAGGHFSFAGEAGDVVLVVFGTIDYTSSLEEPALQLLNDGVVLTSASGFGTVEIVYKLQATSTYIIDASALEPGAYQLQLVNVQQIEPGAIVKGSLSDEDAIYYAVMSEDGFTLTYELLGGEFRPGVEVSVPGQYGFEAIAGLSGSNLIAGELVIEPVEEGTLYVVSVARSLFNFTTGDPVSDFELTYVDTADRGR